MPGEEDFASWQTLPFGHQVEIPGQEGPMEGIKKVLPAGVRMRSGRAIASSCWAARSGCPAGDGPPMRRLTLFSEEDPMANVEDVFNAVTVRGNATGT